MIKEELELEERKRVSRLGGLARGKALTPSQRSKAAREAANVRHHGVKQPGRRRRKAEQVELS